MGTSLEEQEETINLFPKAVQQEAEIYSCIPGHVRRYRRLAEEYPEDVVIEKEDSWGGIFLRVPATWISVRKPRTVNMTDEQKAASAARLQAARLRREVTEHDAERVTECG